MRHHEAEQNDETSTSRATRATLAAALALCMGGSVAGCADTMEADAEPRADEQASASGKADSFEGLGSVDDQLKKAMLCLVNGTDHDRGPNHRELTGLVPAEDLEAIGNRVYWDENEFETIEELFSYDELSEEGKRGLVEAARSQRRSPGHFNEDPGKVHRREESTRRLPRAKDIVDIEVRQPGYSYGGSGQYAIFIENVSDNGPMTTPISPVVEVSHDGSANLADRGTKAGAALEKLAETGKPRPLAEKFDDKDGVAKAEVHVRTDIKGTNRKGPARPGETYVMSVNDRKASYIDFATMVVESNDAFITLEGGGVRTIEPYCEPGGGTIGNADDCGDEASGLERRIENNLVVYDAGTEANEVPGVGPNQAPRQASSDAGADDPNDRIRRYAPETNDLEGPSAGGFAEVSVERNGDSFAITLTNTSRSTAYPGSLSPLAWTVHDGSASFFETGTAASSGLESLAEDGKAGALVDELSGGAVGAADVQAAHADGNATGPIADGQSYSFTVEPTEDHRFVNLASMVIPSNDTFLALGPKGVPLLDAKTGELRSTDRIAEDLEEALRAYDAGTEVNQAGAAGPDQPPRQAGPDTGPSERVTCGG